MKRVAVIALCIFALVAGTSLGAHAMHHAQGGESVSASMSEDHSVPHGSNGHHDAHCCVVSLEHCGSVLLRSNGDGHLIRFTMDPLSRPLNNLAAAQTLPEVALPPPRI